MDVALYAVNGGWRARNIYATFFEQHISGHEQRDSIKLFDNEGYIVGFCVEYAEVYIHLFPNAHRRNIRKI